MKLKLRLPLLAAALSAVVAMPLPGVAATKHTVKPGKSHTAHANSPAKRRAPLSHLGFGSNSTANPTGAATTGAR